jgi:hypothetical protein
MSYLETNKAEEPLGCECMPLVDTTMPVSEAKRVEEPVCGTSERVVAMDAVLFAGVTMIDGPLFCEYMPLDCKTIVVPRAT